MNPVLVTGGCGFIGSQLVRELEQRGYPVVVFDKLTYAGDPGNLSGTKARLVVGDICDADIVNRMLRENPVDKIFHLAADSHVARSFNDAQRFIQTNVAGTEVLLNQAALAGIKDFLHVSTDEVLGSVPTGFLKEDAPLRPRNPYSSSKAAAEMVVSAYREYRQYPVKMVRLSNCYGPRQHVEKLIPATINRLMKGERPIVHGLGTQKRDWLHVADAARGIVDVMEEGFDGETYHLPGNEERSVATVVGAIMCMFDSTTQGALMVDDRPGGNDMRYGIDGSKAFKELGWLPQVDFSHGGLPSTVAWYRNKLAEAA